MTWLDCAVLGVVGVSIVWGLWRGLVREVISIAGWVIAFLAANLLAGPLAEHVPRSVPSPQLRILVAYLGVFLATLAVTTLVGLLLAKLVKAVGLGGLDRGLGALFGTARGLLLVLAAALLAGLTSMPRQPYWRHSVSGVPLAHAALLLKPWLPKTFAERLRYD
jgi:membrane protein required for colicin V production